MLDFNFQKDNPKILWPAKESKKVWANFAIINVRAWLDRATLIFRPTNDFGGSNAFVYLGAGGFFGVVLVSHGFGAKVE